MARPHKERKVNDPPMMMGFMPYGISDPSAEEVLLSFEEYESVRLIDYQKKSHEDAADIMQVSRPTFTRIYNKAVQTIAKALIEGKRLKIDGGNFTMEEQWYRCRNCDMVRRESEINDSCVHCAEHGGSDYYPINPPKDAGHCRHGE